MNNPSLSEAIESSLTLEGGLAIAMTVALFSIFQIVHRRLLPYSLAHPLILTAACIGISIITSTYTLEQYQHAVTLLHWALGPITVALAVPLYQQWHEIRRQGFPLIAGIVFGGVVAPLLAWLSVGALESPLTLQLTFLAKSITTPLAIDASNAIGGEPALAAVFVIVTGVVGATFSQITFRLLKVQNKQAQGIALGTVAHAVGTAKAVSEDSMTGACASMALCLNGLMTVIILPLLF